MVFLTKFFSKKLSIKFVVVIVVLLAGAAGVGVLYHYRHTIPFYTTIITTKNKELRESKRTISEKNNAIAALQKKLAEDEKTIQQLNGNVATSNTALQQTQQSLAKSDAQIQDLQKKGLPKAQKYQNGPILTASTDSAKWDSNNHVAGNCIVKDAHGTINLFYYAGTKDGASVGLARSKDNKKFTKLSAPVLTPGPTGTWDSGVVSVYPNCIIQRNDGTYWMYYSGSPKGSPDFYWNKVGAIGVAFSKDLIHWSKYENNPIFTATDAKSWESEGIFEPSVYFNGDEYGGKDAFMMWYGGNAADGRMGIGLATSNNGVTWTRYSKNPVLMHSKNSNNFDAYTIEVHSVVKYGNGFVMAYEATDRKFPSRFAIGLASSTNGKTWKKSADNPILQAGPVGSWDSFGVYHPSIVIDANKIYLYYVGLNSTYTHAIGVAEINPTYFPTP
ncbi:MAG: hypothetical protein V1907_04185 [Candidatus Kerfeldbacteria bacterium]